MSSRVCCQCNTWNSSDNYSSNQWRKGEGVSRCADCVIGYTCEVCNRRFNSSNELRMHSQVHRPKTVSCPVCGEARFGSAANAVQHVESGYCTGCTGRDNARQQTLLTYDKLNLSFCIRYKRNATIYHNTSDA